MIRLWWLGAFVIGLVTVSAFAKLGTVTTTDGRILIGDVQEGPDGKTVDVTMHGSTITVARSDVLTIVYAADADTDFRQRLVALDPNDVKGRLDLSQRELDQRQYDLAAEAARDAERIDPHNPDAVILLDTIQSQRTLESRIAQTAPSADVAAAVANPSNRKYLTMDDVYAIRRAELRPDDNVRLQFYFNVRQRYLGLHGNSAAFYAETPAQQALDILNSGDPNLAKDVHIDSDPRVLLEFRSEVQPRILAGCAAAGCHAGGAGGFFLYSDAKDLLPAYTDFYILQKTGRKIEGGGAFGRGPVYRPMIDRLRPESSLILQFGLPLSEAATPHPDVKGFKPLYRSTSDARYVQALHWIESLSPLTPDYGIKFDLPSSDSATTRGS